VHALVVKQGSARSRRHSPGRPVDGSEGLVRATAHRTRSCANGVPVLLGSNKTDAKRSMKIGSRVLRAGLIPVLRDSRPPEQGYGVASCSTRS